MKNALTYMSPWSLDVSVDFFYGVLDGQQRQHQNSADSLSAGKTHCGPTERVT